MPKIQINGGLTVDYSDDGWTEYVKWLDGTYGKLQFVWIDEGLAYAITAMDGEVYRTLSINKTDASDFETNYKVLAPKQVKPSTNEDGHVLQSVEPRLGTEKNFVTPGYSDKTTWYFSSTRVTDETLSDSGDGLIWNSVEANWVDLMHGNVNDEDNIRAKEGTHGYEVVVTVNAVEKTMRPAFKASGGDYEVDYKTGAITFFASQTGKTVKASYSHANGTSASLYKIVPSAGLYLDIEGSEAQFSADTNFNTEIFYFEVWVYNPADLPNKILYERVTYKSLRNFIDEARGAYPEIPSIGGAAQGTTKSTSGFPFRYGTVRRLRSSQGAELRIYLQDDIEMLGEHVTATFYCTSHTE